MFTLTMKNNSALIDFLVKEEKTVSYRGTSPSVREFIYCILIFVVRHYMPCLLLVKTLAFVYIKKK